MIDKQNFNSTLLDVLMTKLYEQGNRQGIRNYYQNKKLLDNIEVEESLSKVERFCCYNQTQKWIVKENLKECVL
jgi:hypothetical protein